MPSRPLKTVITVLAVEPDTRLGCCDVDGPALWVRVTAWSPRRAFLTDAAPFLEVSGKAAEHLPGLRFFADLDLNNPPKNDDTSGEQLAWPGLGLCPPVPREWLTGEDGQSAGGRLTWPEPALTVAVLGDPGPQGSKTHVGGGRMIESSAKVRPWRDTVAWTAIRERNRVRGWKPLTGEVALSLTFTLARPRSHYGTGRNASQVRPAAPARPTGTPDLDKLIRSTQDALKTARILRDDSLVVEYRDTGKWYDTDHGQAPGVLDASGCTIRVWSLEQQGASQ
ncbi:RusA family crossover junction endodeoxyribonuclease [Streptomyces sp. NPDC088847]|uniref:RusA family crossover junction endodeoxyribonuclease n=1 Tax=Streptomyces sp. NPDC088847 TaxID=3365909 RepID=UPI00380EDE4C